MPLHRDLETSATLERLRSALTSTDVLRVYRATLAARQQIDEIMLSKGRPNENADLEGLRRRDELEHGRRALAQILHREQSLSRAETSRDRSAYVTQPGLALEPIRHSEAADVRRVIAPIAVAPLSPQRAPLTLGPAAAARVQERLDAARAPGPEDPARAYRLNRLAEQSPQVLASALIAAHREAMAKLDVLQAAHRQARKDQDQDQENANPTRPSPSSKFPPPGSREAVDLVIKLERSMADLATRLDQKAGNGQSDRPANGLSAANAPAGANGPVDARGQRMSGEIDDELLQRFKRSAFALWEARGRGDAASVVQHSRALDRMEEPLLHLTVQADRLREEAAARVSPFIALHLPDGLTEGQNKAITEEVRRLPDQALVLAHTITRDTARAIDDGDPEKRAVQVGRGLNRGLVVIERELNARGLSIPPARPASSERLASNERSRGTLNQEDLSRVGRQAGMDPRDLASNSTLGDAGRGDLGAAKRRRERGDQGR